MEKTANSIVKLIQVKSFGEEIRVLSANSDSRIEINKSSKLHKLDPLLDSDGLLRGCGRLGKCRLSHSEAHPLVLLKQSNTSKVIIRWCHENITHGARAMTLNNFSSSENSSSDDTSVASMISSKSESLKSQSSSSVSNINSRISWSFRRGFIYMLFFDDAILKIKNSNDYIIKKLDLTKLYQAGNF